MKKIILATLLLNMLMTTAQETKKTYTLSGTVDTYFRSNLNAPNKADILGTSPFTSFANEPGFSLGMVNIIAKQQGEKVGFVGDLVFGPRGESASNTLVNQLYMYYRISDKLQLTLGKFNTFLGYEVISPSGNFNYSTSYMFSNGPFSHTGLRADFTLSNDSSLMLAIMNATDDTERNSTDTYTLGLQYGYKGQYLNMIYGDQDTNPDTRETFQIDYTGGFNISDELYLGINTTYQTTKVNSLNDNVGFYGTALYMQLKVSDTFEIGLRPEYFNSFTGNINSRIFATTLSGNIILDDNLVIIPELRIDSGSNKIFVDKNLNPQKNLSSFVMAAIYKF